MPPSDDAPTRTLNGHPPAATTAVAPTPPPGSTAPGDGADDFENWALGASPGRYQLVSFHKGGGLGQVWRAEDTVVRRTVALKCLRPDRLTPALMARFVREAQVTGQLEHPNIVPLYDLFEAAGGPAYAMRFLDGDTLAAAANLYHDRRTAGTAGPLELPRLLGAFVLVCEAVAFAHSKGVLHRDLKGQNILLGHFGEVCVADWGLAKRVGDPDRPGDPSPLSPPLDAMTEPGAVMGTPAFMAPEVARKQPATPASDVYGLGAVLYQVLTNTLPHTGTTPEILSKLEAGTPVLPARALNPSLHPALDAVCRTALSREPTARYPSATALADEVRAFLAGEPVAAYPEPFAARAARWVRRHRAGVLAAVVGLAVLAVASVGWGAMVWREKERAEANYTLASELARSVTDAVGQIETGVLGGRAEMQSRRMAAERAANAAERFLAAQPDDPDHLRRTAMLLAFAGNLARLVDDLPGAARSFEASTRIQQRLSVGLPRESIESINLALTHRDASIVLAADGRLEAAADLIGQAVGRLEPFGSAGVANPDGRRALGLLLSERAFLELKLGHPGDAAAFAAHSAAIFAGLTAVPTGSRHPLDAVFQGISLTVQAEALRDEVRTAGGQNYSVALATHAEAAEVFRWAVEVNPGVDTLLNAHQAQLELARTRLLAGHKIAALTDAHAAVAGLRRMWADHRGVPLYQHHLAAGLTVRGQVRAALAVEPGQRGLAAADLHAAATLLEPLILNSPTRPAYRAAYGDAWAGLARLSVHRDDREVWYYQAVSAYTSAAKYAPDHHGYRTTRDAARAEAVAAGFNPDRRPARLAAADL